MVSRRSLVGSSAPLLIDPMLRASGYASERVARADKRRRRRRGGDNDNLEDTGDEVVEELPEATEEHIGKRKHVRGNDGARDRILHARQQQSGDVEWVDQYFSADPWATPTYEDDFYNFNGWTASGPGSVTTQVGTETHPGIVRVATGATSGNKERLHLGTGGTDTILVPGNFDATFIVKPVIITNVVFRVGFADDWTVDLPNNWFGFEFDSATANWHNKGRIGAATFGDTDTGVAAGAGTWARFRIRIVTVGGTSSVYGSVNGGTEWETTGSAITAAMQPGFYARTTENVTKQLDVDYYRYQPFGVVR